MAVYGYLLVYVVAVKHLMGVVDLQIKPCISKWYEGVAMEITCMQISGNVRDSVSILRDGSPVIQCNSTFGNCFSYSSARYSIVSSSPSSVTMRIKRFDGKKDVAVWTCADTSGPSNTGCMISETGNYICFNRGVNIVYKVESVFSVRYDGLASLKTQIVNPPFRLSVTGHCTYPVPNPTCAWKYTLAGESEKNMSGRLSTLTGNSASCNPSDMEATCGLQINTVPFEFAGKSLTLALSISHPSLPDSPIELSSSAVLTFPAKYSLTGSADYAVSGSPFTFSCNSGNVVSRVKWYINDFSFTTYQSSGTSECYIDYLSEYVCSCSGGTVFNLTINSVHFSKHNTAWRCGYQFGGSESTVVTLKVHVPLQNTRMSSRPSFIFVGLNSTLQCETSPCFPNATMTWTLNKRETAHGVNTTQYAVDSGVITRSLLTRLYTWADHLHIIYCSAMSAGTTKSSSHLQIIIHVPVTFVTLLNITSQNGTIEVYEGSIILTCVTSPSNPAPSIFWQYAGPQIIRNITVKTPPGLIVTTSSLYLNVSRFDNGNTVHCLASIPTQTLVKPDVISRIGLFEVFHPPDTPQLLSGQSSNWLDHQPWLEHSLCVLLCVIPNGDIGKPPSTFYWMRNGVDIQHTGSNYSFTATKEDNGDQFTCTAGNLFTDRPGHMRPASNVFKLNVHYSPRVKILSDNHTRVELGKLLILRCSADSNPDKPKFEWKLGTKHLVDGPVLQIASFRQSDQGEYTCTATVQSSSFGSLTSSANVIVTVLEAAPVSCYCTGQSVTAVDLVWKHERSGKSTGFTIAHRLTKDTHWLPLSMLDILSDGNTFSLHISDLESHSSYYFKIFSSVNKDDSNYCLTTCRTLSREAISTEGLGLGSGIAIGLVIGIVVASIVAVLIITILMRKAYLIRSDAKGPKETDVYQDITMGTVQQATSRADEPIRTSNEPTNAYDILQSSEPTQYQQLYVYNGEASQTGRVYDNAE